MSNATPSETARLLTASEQEAVDLTSPSAITGLSRPDLQALARRLREARDRARAMASQQRREMRGKSAPRGATPARDDAGTVAKEQLLADAVKRITKQLQSTSAKPLGGLPTGTRSKKATAPRPTSEGVAATPSSHPTVLSDASKVERMSKTAKSVQEGRKPKPQ